MGERLLTYILSCDSRNIYIKKSFKNILLNYSIKLLTDNVVLFMQTLKTNIEWINYFSPKVVILCQEENKMKK